MTSAEVHLRVKDLQMLFPVAQKTWIWNIGPRKWVHAVDGVDIELYRGECLALVGESGSGKTTLANCIAGSLVPGRGEIWLDDTMITGGGKLRGLDRSQRARRIQVIFQDPTSALNRTLRIGSALTEPLLVHALSDKQSAHRRVAELLERVGLTTDTADQYPHELNASQRQRVVIARALALEPEILIADEPIAKLDVSMQGQILNLIDQLRQELGLSVIFITHDLSVVRQVASRVAVLYLGQLMEVEKAKTFFTSPGHPYSQALLKSTPRLRLSTSEHHALYTISGEIPSPIDVPAGCPFISRCPEGDESCSRERPAPSPTSEHGFVACFKREVAGDATPVHQ